jgi:inorganic triphosphatase YgiF
MVGRIESYNVRNEQEQKKDASMSKQHNAVQNANTEIELKLLFDPANEKTLRKHSLLAEYAKEKPRSETLESTYFDTPDLSLRHRRVALRVRKTVSGWRQTLKAGGTVEAGLHQHNEWETDVAGPALELDKLRQQIEPTNEWKSLLAAPELAEHLAPVFTTRFTRTIWDLQLPDDTQIEFAIDVGSINCGTHSEAISEVEMELKAGDPKQLYRLGLQLLDKVPLHIGNINKAVRGYALYQPSEELPAVKAEPVALTPDMSVEQAFAAIVGNCMSQVQGNENGVLLGMAPESVHQMRVGARRLRSALRLFRDVVPVPAPLREELGWLATELGAVRDWEVLAGSTLGKVIDGSPEESGMAWLRTAINGVARERREQVAEALRSPRYAKLVLTLADWRMNTGWREGMDDKQVQGLEAPVAKFADAALQRGHKRLKKRGKQLRSADASERHLVRIAAKRQRYTAEFFHSLCRPKRAKKYVKALSRLQDELGWLNDASVAQRLLPGLKEMHPALSADVDFTRGFLHCAVHHAEEPLFERWDRFAHARLPHAAK